MIERRRWIDGLTHATLIAGVLLVAFPLYIVLVTATLDAQEATRVPLPLVPSTHLLENLVAVWRSGAGDAGAPFGVMLANSLIMALGIAVGKIAVSILSAFAIVYFGFPLRSLAFWLIFVTLMLPVEVRIFPSVAVVAQTHLMNSYTGLTLPLIASATATFLFRQFFQSLPKDLADAARIDGAGAMQFFYSIVLPLSKTNIAALFVITFIYGWNQYLWPLLVTNTPAMTTAVVGIKSMIGSGDAATSWQLVMAATLLSLVPPLAVLLSMQRWFVRGLIDVDKKRRVAVSAVFRAPRRRSARSREYARRDRRCRALRLHGGRIRREALSRRDPLSSS